MAASPNGVRSFHDGDGSDFGHAGPDGSQAIEDVFFRFFEENSLPAETTPFDGGSDYEPFLRAGIPGGGLFTGDEKRKTRAQVQAYGGVAGKHLDPCYHEACDTIATPTRTCSRKCPAPWPTPPSPTPPGGRAERQPNERSPARPPPEEGRRRGPVAVRMCCTRVRDFQPRDRLRLRFQLRPGRARPRWPAGLRRA